MNYLSNLIGKNYVAPVTLPGTPQITNVTVIGDFPTEAINIAGMSRIILKTTFSGSNITLKARMIFYDSNNVVLGYTDEFYIKNSGISESERYHGSLFVFSNEVGASKAKIKVTTAPSAGNAQMTIGTTK